MHHNHSHHQTPDESGNTSNVVSSQSPQTEIIYNLEYVLKDSSWDQGLSTEKNWKQSSDGLQNKRGFKDSMWWQGCKSLSSVVFLTRSCMCVDRSWSQGQHTTKCCHKHCPTPCCQAHPPHPWAPCSPQGARGEAAPYRLVEKRWGEEGQARQHSMHPKPALTTEGWNSDLEREGRFLGQWLS